MKKCNSPVGRVRKTNIGKAEVYILPHSERINGQSRTRIKCCGMLEVIYLLIHFTERLLCVSENVSLIIQQHSLGLFL